MKKFIILRSQKQEDRQAALDLVTSSGGRQVEIHPLGTLVECSEEIAEALDLTPAIGFVNLYSRS
jgi:hypothetical protein